MSLPIETLNATSIRETNCKYFLNGLNINIDFIIRIGLDNGIYNKFKPIKLKNYAPTSNL